MQYQSGLRLQEKSEKREAVTEVDLDNIQDWDYIIDNNKDYETLRKNVLEIVEKLR